MLVVLCLLAAIGASLAQTEDICKSGFCECQNITTIARVDCRCNETNQDLLLTRYSMATLKRLSLFMVTDCRSLTFERSSFAGVRELQHMKVWRVDDVVLPNGVFSYVDHLFLRDVKNVMFGSRALMGVLDILSVTMERCGVAELPKYALYDARNIRKILLSDVRFGVVRSQSVHVMLDDHSSEFVLENCTVEHVEAGGMVVSANNVRVSGTTFHSADGTAVNITSAVETQMFNNTFGANVSSAAFHVAASANNVSNNTFHQFSENTLRHLFAPLFLASNSSEKQLFSNNRLLAFDDTNFEIRSLPHSLCFVQNVFSCDCTLAHWLAIEVEAGHSPLYEANKCDSKCNESLRSLVRRIEERDVCTNVLTNDTNPIDDSFLCQSVLSDIANTSTTSVPVTTSELVTRDGRRLHEGLDPRQDPRTAVEKAEAATSGSTLAVAISSVCSVFIFSVSRTLSIV